MDNPNAAIRMPRLEGRAQSLHHSEDRVAAMPGAVDRAGTCVEFMVSLRDLVWWVSRWCTR